MKLHLNMPDMLSKRYTLVSDSWEADSPEQVIIALKKTLVAAAVIWPETLQNVRLVVPKKKATT